MVAKQFREWACSLSGCDNSNVGADIWLSGIEFGIRADEREKYYKGGLQDQIANGPYNPPEFYDWQDGLTYTYGQSMAKLLCANSGRSVEDYKDYSDDCNRSEVFKANLYPIAFRNTNDEHWKVNGLDKITGFENKHLYQIWCFFNRFPHFASLVEKHKPKLIIGTGVSFLMDFFACFGGNLGKECAIIETGELENKEATPKNNHVRRYYWTRPNDSTTLVVIPFFSGRYGLNSGPLLQEMGEKLRSLVDQNLPQAGSSSKHIAVTV